MIRLCVVFGPVLLIPIGTKHSLEREFQIIGWMSGLTSGPGQEDPVTMRGANMLLLQYAYPGHNLHHPRVLHGCIAHHVNAEVVGRQRFLHVKMSDFRGLWDQEQDRTYAAAAAAAGSNALTPPVQLSQEMLFLPGDAMAWYQNANFLFLWAFVKHPQDGLILYKIVGRHYEQAGHYFHVQNAERNVQSMYGITPYAMQIVALRTWQLVDGIFEGEGRSCMLHVMQLQTLESQFTA